MAIDLHHPRVSVRRQCELLGLSPGTLYYKPRAGSDLNQALMSWIDRQYIATPFYGYRKMTRALRDEGYDVNLKRVRRLMRQMGLEAVYPKPRTSLQNKAHPVYPYLLKDLEIARPNQVWCTDITYIPLRRGWVYLVAVMDWFSRYVLSWEVSVTLDVSFCVEALERALSLATPEIFNSDQGSQFTSEVFTGVLKSAGVKISMDGRGRVFDNIFIERLWRSLKYEEVYLRDYQTPPEATRGIGGWVDFYNHRRPHQALDYRTPAEVYGLPKPLVEAGPGEKESPAVVAPVALRAPSATTASTPGGITLI